ncbi:homing endonuclease associated repeat-containing protein [Patescibacteria group bacterium]
MYQSFCLVCGKLVKRNLQRVNESNKFGWKTYCSLKCLGVSRRKRKKYICARGACNNVFEKVPSDTIKSKRSYCSHRCAAIVSNKEHPKNIGVIKICAFCGKKFKSRKKYCSRKCKDLGSVIPAENLINQIKDFFRKNERIPYKREVKHYHAIRSRFGSWNNAVRAAGYNPNPVIFADKHIAKDGHNCDSLAEKIIDDWFYKRGIKHKINVLYPGGDKFTCDFVIGKHWVEYFGLHGEHRRYDELRDKKLQLAKKMKLKLMGIYSTDLFPENKLSSFFLEC